MTRSRTSTDVVLPRPLAAHRPIRLSSAGRQAVAGEGYHRAQIRRLVGRQHAAVVRGPGLDTSAFLVRDPVNRYDENAVRVRLRRGARTVLVGYLPRGVAACWSSVLSELEQRGRVAECPARVHGRVDGYRVVLHLAEPADALFANDEPDGATLLPAGAPCALVGPGGDRDALLPYVEAAGPVWATLHPATTSRGEPTIEARVDGVPVGRFAGPRAERHLGLLDRGAVVACEARVRPGAAGPALSLLLPEPG